MKTKEGKYIISCVMTDNVRRDGPCASCMHFRNWVNCESLHEGDESFCDCKNVATEELA